ncbi:hypothetical protein [Staphylococcus sp. UMB10092B]|uniref:hypothetical protein n=1 Tax=Staphylococcus sp. UMB10092B TaxID=3046317 RepID=UPI002553489F|nr:hypothetical protein [Staphylococcus sp. UMB10092B]
MHKINLKQDRQVQETIEQYCTVQQIKCINRTNESVIVEFDEYAFDLSHHQVNLVDDEIDERVEINAPLYNETDINILFEKVLNDTYYYISKERYQNMITLE